LWSAIGANPEAKFAADTLALINQSNASFEIFINGRSGTSGDARRIKTMHAGKGKKILIYLLIAHLGPDSIYSD
jgi:hypothetical protein